MLEQAAARSRLGVGLQPRRWSGDPNAWKRALGNNNRVPARLEMLPDAKPRWNLYGASAALQTALLLFLLMIPLFYPERLRYAMHYDVMPLTTPLTEVPIAPRTPKPKPPKPKIERSEEHTSELQSLAYLVCRLLLEKKKNLIDYKASALHISIH